MGDTLWMVAKFISHHVETTVETITLLGICRGIDSSQGF